MNKSYNLYISEIKDNILSPEEELRLIKVYQEKQTGWEEAQDRIIKSNLMFVVKVAFEFTNDPNKISDLISEGNIALLNALNRFKSDKGAKLISYANYEIRGKMARLFINETRLSYLNIPERTRIKLGKISKFIDEFKIERIRIFVIKIHNIIINDTKSKEFRFKRVSYRDITLIDFNFFIKIITNFIIC